MKEASKICRHMGVHGRQEQRGFSSKQWWEAFFEAYGPGAESAGSRTVSVEEKVLRRGGSREGTVSDWCLLTGEVKE